MLQAGVKAVVFDAVGTLIHPDPPAPLVYWHTGRRHGSQLTVQEIGARFLAAFKHEEDRDYASGLRTSEDRELGRWQSIVAHVLDDVTDPDACFRELFEHFSRPQAWRLESGAERLIAELAARGYRPGMASNYDQRLRLVAAGISELEPIDRIIISSEVGWRKPAAEFFIAACRELGLQPEQVLYVGDDPHNDYQGARAVGLQTILFDARNQDEEPGIIRVTTLPELLRGLPAPAT